MPRMYSAENSPEQNLRIFAEHPYHGRVALVGEVGGFAVLGCAIEGRSEGSQNRIYVEEHGIVSTEVFDPSKPTGDPEFTIYDAIRSRKAIHLVGNGDQVDTAIKFLRAKKSVQAAMATREYEGDPLSTPRITGLIDIDPGMKQPNIAISVIQKSDRKNYYGEYIARDYYTDISPLADLVDGIGYAVHTYKGDPETPESFDERPFKIPLESSAEAMVQMLWENTEPKNRVAAAVKFVDKSTGEIEDISIINRHN